MQLKVFDECFWCKTPTWCRPMGNGKPMCGACHVVLFFQKILYPPFGWSLLGWQERDLRGIYGPARAEDGKRLVEQAYVSMAKKNGKTFLIAGLPLYHLKYPDEDRTVKVFGAAAAKDQAGLIFETASMMVNQNPLLRSEFRVLAGTKRILLRNGQGFYHVISAEGDVQDGIEPDLALKDEYHRWKTASAKTLDQVMTKGMLSRPNALEILISTVGVEYESPMWFGIHEKAKRHISGAIQDEKFYASIYAADEKQFKDDPEYWKSREARVAANPSHEDHGGFMLDSKLETEMQKAVANPADRDEYVRYCLNIPISTHGTPVIDMYKWQEGQDVDLRTYPTYDMDLLISKWGLAEKPCWAGVDAAWTTDLFALMLLFPPFGASEQWTVLGFCWLPEERLADIERRTKVPLSDWVRRGFLSLTPGNAVDVNVVAEKLKWAREMFDLQEVCYDPWNYRQAAMSLQEDEFKCTEVRQGYASLSEATKKVLTLYPDQSLRHGNSPILNWHAACLRLLNDNKGNVQPAKPAQLKEAARIDMISALVTAMSRALVANPQSVECQVA